MQDLKNLAIYGGGATLVILFLANLSAITGSTGSLIGYAAIFLVIALPVILSIQLAKKKKLQDEN